MKVIQKMSARYVQLENEHKELKESYESMGERYALSILNNGEGLSTQFDNDKDALMLELTKMVEEQLKEIEELKAQLLFTNMCNDTLVEDSFNDLVRLSDNEISEGEGESSKVLEEAMDLMANLWE